MLRRLTRPFVAYLNWAFSGTIWDRLLALGIPVIFMVVLGIVLSGAAGNDSLRASASRPPAPTISAAVAATRAAAAAEATAAAPAAAGTPASNSTPPAPASPAASRTNVTPASARTATPSAGLTLISVTSPVKRGDQITLSLQTRPMADCSVLYTNPNGRARTTKDVEPRAANAKGIVTWHIGTSTATSAGTANAVVTCGPTTLTIPIETT